MWVRVEACVASTESQGTELYKSTFTFLEVLSFTGCLGGIALEEFQSDHMTFIPKPQTLVVELLSHIFLECLPKSSLVQLKSNEAPLNVSQVCRYWRNVSLSIRRLWTRLRVLCLDDGTALEYTLPALHAFLDRSGSADFRVEFTTPSTNHTNRYPGHHQHLTPMRWETIQVLLTEL